MTLLSVFLFLTNILLYVESIDNSELSEGSNKFGYGLWNELYEDSFTNIWISPFCITSCFSLIYPGSNGNTQNEIANVMGYPTDNNINTNEVTQQFFILQSLIKNTYNGQRLSLYDNKGSIIGIANKIYSSYLLSLKQTYIDSLTIMDDTDNIKESFIDYNFDFAAKNATKIINQWVNDNSNGLIDSIIDENKDISYWRLVAMNAIYLNGTFKNQFISSMTSLNKFYMNGLRETVIGDCHLMHQINYFQYYSNGDYQFIKFDFSDLNKDLFVLFALPINNKLYKNGLIKDINIIKTAINNLEIKYIALALPKISIQSTYILNKPLNDMGIIDAFTYNADFSGITVNESLFIDTIIHKTMIEMDEKGLVASAVTIISMAESAAVTTKPTPILFKADHSYQMFIIDGEHNNTILFMGHINNPGIPKHAQQPIYDESTDSVWTQHMQQSDGTNSDKLNKQSLIVIIIVIIIVVIAIFMYFVINNHKKKKQILQKQSIKNFVTLDEDDNEDVILGNTANTKEIVQINHDDIDRNDNLLP